MGKKKSLKYVIAGVVGLIAVFALCFLFYIKTGENSGILSDRTINGADESALSAERPQPPAEDDVIFTVDDYPVSSKEFSLFIRDQRSDAAQYFHTTYGAEMKSGFWTTEFDGQTPSEYCKEKALEEIVRYKTERILAYERGLIEAVDYSDLMADMESLNEKNAEKAAAGEVTYGLTAFEPWQYLLYIRSDCNAKLIKDETERLMGNMPEETIRARYEEEKENYGKGYRVTYERLDADSSVSGVALETALDQIAERASINEESLEDAAAALKVLEDYSVKQEISSEKTVGKDDIWEQFVQEEVMKLEPGMISAPLLLSDSNGCLLRGIERTDLGYESFEDVKISIVREYAEEELETALEQRAKDASVNFVGEKYEQFTVE